jgi:RNA 2',3'-cyclic 3'-phosphodiesterase
VRLFVALEIPATVRECLAELIAELRAVALPVRDKRPRWVRPENLHVTLKFIGQFAPENLARLRSALECVRSPSAVEMNFRGLGFFPHEKRPRVLWAGLQASENLAALAAEVDRATATQGIAAETRVFAPHLTLARFEPPAIHEKLRAAVQQNLRREFGAARTAEFHLIESKLNSSGAQYTTLQSFRFAAEN